MALPVNKPRRKQEGFSKLEKELWLYKALYDDQKLRKGYRPVTDDDERDLLGVPLGEICRYLAPDISEQTFLRTLNRYLRELVDCGVLSYTHVRRFQGKRYCVAEIRDEPKAPMQNRGSSGNQHLCRLARTTRLMKKWIEQDDLPERYDEHPPLYGRFFWTLSEAEMWYQDNFGSFSDISVGIIRQDIRKVWNVISKEE